MEPVPLPPARPPVSGRVATASYVLMAGALLLVMWQGLLPGLLCVCLGFLLTRWLTPRFARLQRSADSRLGQTLAAALVVAVPLLLLALALSRSRSYVIEAPQQYRELLDFMARTVL